MAYIPISLPSHVADQLDRAADALSMPPGRLATAILLEILQCGEPPLPPAPQTTTEIPAAANAYAGDERAVRRLVEEARQDPAP